MPTPLGKEPDWFDKLPRKTRIVLMMLVTGTISLGLFLDGVHLSRTGEVHSNAGYEVSSWTSFFWSAFWFVLTAMLLAAFFGWLQKGEDDPPKGRDPNFR